jgi:hypothetical protein
MALLSMKRGRMKRLIPKTARRISMKSRLINPFVPITIILRRSKVRRAMFYSNQFTGFIPVPPLEIFPTKEVSKPRFVELGLALTYLSEMLVAS